MLIDGIHVPLTAPFYRDGRSYLRKLEHNVGRYSLTPATGLVALPPGGEASLLTDAEQAESLQIVAATAAPEKVLIAGIAKNSVFAALALTAQAAEAGFDAIVLSAPASVTLDRAGGKLFVNAVADASALPVLLSGSPSVESIAAIAQHENIIGLYDDALTSERYAALARATQSVQREVTVTTVFTPVTRRMKAPAATGDATFVSAESLSGSSSGGAAVAVAPPPPALKSRTRTVGFQIMAAGPARDLVAMLQAGIAGALPSLAACAPQACHEVYAAFKDGNPALAEEKCERLVAADALMQQLGIAGIKYACDLNGYYGGHSRLPGLPLTGEYRASVEAVMSSLRA
jgi:4-hydroxy-2-oxoglutarate aldolase